MGGPRIGFTNPDQELAHLSRATRSINRLRPPLVFVIGTFATTSEHLVLFRKAMARVSEAIPVAYVCSVTDAPTPAARFVRTALKAFSTCSVNARQWRNEWENDRRSDKNTDSMSVAADVLLDLYALYERLFIETGAVSVEVSGTRRPGWWKSRPAIVADLERWRVRLEREAEGGRDFGAFRELLSSQHRLLRRLERRVAPNDSALFVAASALSFVSAECHVSRSFGGSSLMLLNRAVEYALCALAIENGAARFANSGVILDSGAQCSVYELLNVSDRTNSLAPNSTSRAIFQRVNTTRNQLSFTHGLARVCAKDVAGVIDEVKAAIKGLNPTSGWAAAVRALQVRRSSVEIALARVFGVSENVVTYELM